MTSVLEMALDNTLKRPNTIKNYRVAVRDFQTFAGEDPSQWTGATVVHWRNHLLEKGLAKRSVNTKLAALRSTVSRAAALGYLPASEFVRAAEFLPVVYEKKRFAIPLDQGQRILKTTKGNSLEDLRDNAILSLGFYRGARRESIATLELERVDFSKHIAGILIKGGRIHQMPLDPTTKESLHTWKQALGNRGVKHGPFFRHVKDGRLGRPLSTDYVGEIVKKRATQAGISGFTTHMMRHCFVSWAVASGHTMEDIMRVTGHRSPNMILEYMTEIHGTEAPKGLVPVFEE